MSKVVKIKQGKYTEGIMDKASIGENASGGLFHTIYEELGPTDAIDCMFNLQQLTNQFLLYVGSTFGIGDCVIPKDAADDINFEVQKIIKASLEVAEQYKAGKIIPPVDMTVDEFYEEKQMAVLDHGDEFMNIIMNSIDHDKNNLYKFKK